MVDSSFGAMLNARARSVKARYRYATAVDDEDGDDVRNPSAGLTSVACSVLFANPTLRRSVQMG